MANNSLPIPEPTPPIPVNGKPKPFWKSKTWWSSIIGSITPILGWYLDMPIEYLALITASLLTYIGGEKFKDAMQ